MTAPRGHYLAVVLMDVEAGYDEEVTRWYETEHRLERLACPGFVRADRYRAAGVVAGAEDYAPSLSPAYLVLYEVESLEALRTPQYLDSIRNPSAWTRRIREHFEVFVRQTYAPY